MSFQLLTEKEAEEVEKTIDELLGFSAMTLILEKKNLIKIKGRRHDVYMVLSEDLPLLEHLSFKISVNNFSVVHAGVKLGFFIHEKFLIGIESLTLLAPLTRKKIQLNERHTQQFIFGKDIKVNTPILRNQIAPFEENSTIIIFSQDNIAIGYAKIRSKENNPWLQNLVDVGIFLRSEKSAF